MTVPDTICGLAVRHDCHTVSGRLVDTWSVETPEGQFQIVRTPHGTVYLGGAQCISVEDAVTLMRGDIMELAAECRAFADKVLGERQP